MQDVLISDFHPKYIQIFALKINIWKPKIQFLAPKIQILDFFNTKLIWIFPPKFNGF